MPTNADAKKLTPQYLLKWYKRSGRRYPWRRSRDPYKVLIAEIMLQRTRADQVLPVYLSFIKKYPTVRKLSEASLEEIGTYFARLGLLWRAELVKRMAVEIMRRFHGKIPESREELLSLPSVGEYMADAVLSFARGKDVAVIDANVCRVVKRIFGLKLKGEARRAPTVRKIVQDMVPKGMARKFNWAIIDFASLMCTPKSPKCDRCPIQELCSFRKTQKA